MCNFVLSQKCSNGHNQSWKCHAGTPPVCPKCEKDRKEALKKAQRDLEEKLKREERSKEHLKAIAQLDEQMAQITLDMKNSRTDREQQAILAQKRKDLEALKDRANKKQESSQSDPLGIYDDDDPAPSKKALDKPSQKSSVPPNTAPQSHSNLREQIKTAVEHNKSPSKTEWQRQKDQENASNPAIDKIMEMIGLEEVKAKVLRIKAKVETSIRQNADLKKERLGLVLLGNPGTGMIQPLLRGNQAH